MGYTCFYFALHGAKKVVGIDINPTWINFAVKKKADYKNVQKKVTFKLNEELKEQEKFDIIISKDSLEHYCNPKKSIEFMVQHLRPGGLMAIGVSPLWKSPYGGHLESFSRLPWIHVLIPEKMLMNRLRSYFHDNTIHSFNDVASGLNKMTYKKFLQTIQGHGLQLEFLRLNVSSYRKESIVLNIFNILRHIAPLKEYFTVNVYCILSIAEEQAVIKTKE